VNIDVSIFIILRDARIVRNEISEEILSCVEVGTVRGTAPVELASELPKATGIIVPEFRLFEKYRYTPPIKSAIVDTIRNLLYIFFILFKPIGIYI
jgi:hypothetical protein